jgi:hypothetical protein
LSVLAACGGDDDDDNGDGATPTSTRASGSTPGASTPDDSDDASPTPDDDDDATRPPTGGEFDEARAAALLEAALLKPADLDGTWTVMNDTTTDNAAAAAADPKSTASIERCGRLLSRVVTNQPDDPVGLYISGQNVAYFSTATVYRTAAGAADCAAEAAQRFTADPIELVRAFGTLFIDPAAVVITPLDYPQVGDSTAAFTLAGQIDASGTVVDLTIMAVSFVKGNVTAVVGAANSGMPIVEELTPLVDLVESRIEANQ